MRQTPAAQAAQNAGVPATQTAGFFSSLNNKTETTTLPIHTETHTA